MSEKQSRLQKIYDREGRNTSSDDPKMMNARVFIGNLASDKMSRQEVMKMFEPYGKVLGVSLHKSYGFVQFETEKEAKAAVKATNGNVVEGLRIDVNIATERRKEAGPPERSPRRPAGGHGGRRGHYRSPSPPPFRRHSRYDMDHPPPPGWWERERMGWRGSPPPTGGVPPPYHHDRERDFDRFPPSHMRGEPYGRPRDDPYERYLPLRDRERFGPRPRDFYGSPREGYPPHDRYSYDFPPTRGRGSPPPRQVYERGGPPERERFIQEEWEREKRVGPAPARPEGAAAPETRSVDMEIIVINRQQRDYASVVAGRVRELGLAVQIQQLSPTVSLADALDSAAQQGLLYAVIITSQHEQHSSVTLTILHGRNPQEHKNMPLEDALGLVAKDFDHYRLSGRPMARKPVPSAPTDVSQLLGKAASGASLSSSELSAVISALQKQKQEEEIVSSHHALPPPLEKMEANTPEDIQRQQADLQAKILSLLGSSAVVPSPSSSAAPVISPNSKPVTSGSFNSPSNHGSASYSQESFSGDTGRGGGYASSAGFARTETSAYRSGGSYGSYSGYQ